LKQTVVSNSAIHHGNGFATYIYDAENLTLVNNTMFDFRKLGLEIAGNSKKVTIDGNWIFNIKSRNMSAMSTLDTQAGMIICNWGAKCANISVVNNVVGGVVGSIVDSSAFVVYAHQCDLPNQKLFRNNVAHSVQGYGASVFHDFYDPQSKHGGWCLQVSYFTAYKCAVAGLTSDQATMNLIFSNLVMIDNVASIAPAIG
jgi:hypothetical protein